MPKDRVHNNISINSAFSPYRERATLPRCAREDTRDSSSASAPTTGQPAPPRTTSGVKGLLGIGLKVTALKGCRQRGDNGSSRAVSGDNSEDNQCFGDVVISSLVVLSSSTNVSFFVCCCE